MNTPILPLRQRAEVTDTWLRDRLDNLLPELMRREQFDMWIVVAREYNEDPVTMTLLPATMLSARRRTILMFHLDDTNSLERLILSRYGVGDFYKGAWDPDEEDQWDCLGRLVKERNPSRIAIDVSGDFAHADGLSHTEYEHLVRALGSTFAPRLVGGERLAVGWLETRTGAELAAYPGIVQVAHQLIAIAFSNSAVHPGITSTDDVVWWFRQHISDLGLSAWFHPTVSIQAQGRGFNDNDGRKVILPGDLLHCDVGLHYLGLATDTQQNAYVLRRGEQDAPQGLRTALAMGNRLQDILAQHFVLGQSGNQVLAGALAQAKVENIRASIYTHPIGYHGHGAGPTIGLWDMQQGVPGRGDYPLFNNTLHAMELNVTHAVPEWDGQEVRMALEQDVLFADHQVHFVGGRQTQLHLIG